MRNLFANVKIEKVFQRKYTKKPVTLKNILCNIIIETMRSVSIADKMTRLPGSLKQNSRLCEAKAQLLSYGNQNGTGNSEKCLQYKHIFNLENYMHTSWCLSKEIDYACILGYFPCLFLSVA